MYYFITDQELRTDSARIACDQRLVMAADSFNDGQIIVAMLSRDTRKALRTRTALDSRIKLLEELQMTGC